MYEPADNLGLYGVEPFSEALDGGELYIATGETRLGGAPFDEACHVLGFMTA